jgi:folylpolyglutamate synthase/dihydropteroate synthase
VITRLKTGRGLDPAMLTDDFKDESGVKISVSGSADEAFEKMLADKRAARGMHDGDFRIYIAGSLYLVGEIKGKIKNDKL